MLLILLTILNALLMEIVIPAMTLGTVISESILFIFAGFDTTANALIITLHLLSTRPHIQDRLREEIKEIIAKESGLNYENVNSAPYLNACMNGEFLMV